MTFSNKMNSGRLKILLLVALSLFLSWSGHGQTSQKRPNIIFMMSDDHAYQAISAYGHGLNETPNIDRLAKEGAIFTRATVTNSICAPSRAVVLTGKHSFVNGKVDNIQPFDWDQDNFAKLLQKAGYSTAMIGKIHLDGLPQGFDYSMVLPGQGDYYNPDFIVNGEMKRFEGYVTEITTEHALHWLEEGRDKDKPFLLIYNQKLHTEIGSRPQSTSRFTMIRLLPHRLRSLMITPIEVVRPKSRKCRSMDMLIGELISN